MMNSMKGYGLFGNGGGALNFHLKFMALILTIGLVGCSGELVNTDLKAGGDGIIYLISAEEATQAISSAILAVSPGSEVSPVKSRPTLTPVASQASH